jgi:hypothetical protein
MPIEGLNISSFELVWAESTKDNFQQHKGNFSLKKN